jgi:hypothetical protein
MTLAENEPGYVGSVSGIDPESEARRLPAKLFGISMVAGLSVPRFQPEFRSGTNHYYSRHPPDKYS